MIIIDLLVVACYFPRVNDHFESSVLVLQGHMIVLDLFSEVKPMYQNFESFYGQPFIWNMLHNFGGTIAMYGTIESIHTVSTLCGNQMITRIQC